MSTWVIRLYILNSLLYQLELGLFEVTEIQKDYFFM